MRPLVLLVIALAATACAGPARPVPAPGCPSGRPRTAVSGGFRGPFVLVPGRPVIASSCAYAGGNDRHRDPGRLVRRHVLRGRTVRNLQDDLNREEPRPSGIYHCPADDGAAHLLLFRYAGGGVTRIAVTDNGCRTASNGRRSVQAPGGYPDRYGG